MASVTSTPSPQEPRVNLELFWQGPYTYDRFEGAWKISAVEITLLGLSILANIDINVPSA